MDRASTKGIPEVVSGSSITIEPLDHIILHIPPLVDTTLMKFIIVKSVPSTMCLQTIKDWVNGWLLIVEVQVTCPSTPMSCPEAFLM